MPLPVTDRRLLGYIHRHYLAEFLAYDEEQRSRSSKLYVPIDCAAIGEHFGMDIDLVFGRLYYHLDPRYSFQDESGATVHLFALAVGRDHHAIHFPLLSAVVAELEESHYRFTIPVVVSLLALLFSVTSLLGQIL